jgi:hypothetical protein
LLLPAPSNLRGRNPFFGSASGINSTYGKGVVNENSENETWCHHAMLVVSPVHISTLTFKVVIINLIVHCLFKAFHLGLKR